MYKRQAIDRALKSSDNGYFAYHFTRTVGNHYETCRCHECRLIDTLSSYHMKDFLSRLVGSKITNTGEMFVSKYERGHYLDMHHDKGKGQYAFTISLTKNWNPVYGGLLHFWNQEDKNFYKVVMPMFNSLHIFSIPQTEDKKRNHFVSLVKGPYKRITITGWVNDDNF